MEIEREIMSVNLDAMRKATTGIAERPAAPKMAATRTPAVKIWAFMGAVWLLFSLYIWGKWFLAPEFGPTPRGSDPVPQWLFVWTHTFEVLSTGMWCACIYFWAIKPWRKTGRMSWDGLFILAGATLYIQDPWINYSNYWFLYSSVFINFGSWTTQLPGWMVPHGNLIPEAPLAWGGAYTWLVIAPAIFAGKAIDAIRRKWPLTKTLTLVAVFFLCFAFLDLVLEGSFARTSLYAFASTMPSTTLFAGKPYQFPMYETIFMGSMWSTYTFFRYFRDDKGRSFVERGADRLGLSEGGTTFVRWLALVGAVQAILFLAYNLPVQFTSMHGGVFPKYPSYLVNGVCGPDTPYDCPGDLTPIPRLTNPTNRVIGNPKSISRRQ